jgi:predicted DNA-binding ribbon-helix-helix protein
VVDGGDEVSGRVRSVRLPDALWERLQAVATARGVSVSTVILTALSEYEGKVTQWEKR